MDQNRVQSEVTEVLGTVFGCDVPANASRDDIDAWDSLKHIQMVFAIEAQFDLQFSEDQIPELSSVDRIVASIIQQHASQHPS